MKLYDVGETIREGLPVTVCDGHERVYIDIGKEADDYEESTVVVPFSRELSEHLLSKHNPMNAVDHKAYLFSGAVAREDGHLCIVQHTDPDHTALVRVGIAHGIGGTITYYFGQGVDVITEGVIGVGDERFPVYLLVMLNGSSFHIHRTGDICGLPSEMSFTWNGLRIIQEPG